jgi:hypothetical protein
VRRTCEERAQTLEKFERLAGALFAGLRVYFEAFTPRDGPTLVGSGSGVHAKRSDGQKTS